MIDRIKTYFLLVALTFTALFMPGCRGEVIPTDNDMSSYGWNLYEAGEYVDALDWFTTAIKEDSSHSDAYNGVGWTMGHLRQADSSVFYFNEYLSRDSSSFENILDFYAGLSFGYNAIGDDDNARLFAETYFFGNQNAEIGDPDWCFFHKTDINQLDVRLILAVSEYRLGLFANCQSSINEVYNDLNTQDGSQIPNGEVDNSGNPLTDEYPLNYDHTTISGRTYLANHLSILQTQLASANGENGLKCTENDGQGGGYCQ